MPDEPFYISQCNEPMLPGERADWIRHEVQKANEQGAAWMRASVWPPTGEPKLTLLEAWKERPEDEGDLRFHFSKSDQKK